jgi:hypothetical protein
MHTGCQVNPALSMTALLQSELAPTETHLTPAVFKDAIKRTRTLPACSTVFLSYGEPTREHQNVTKFTPGSC